MRARLLWIVVIVLAFPATAAAQTAPGAPGAKATWTEADKDGYGTSTTRASRVWHTLDDGRLTEVFYPNLGTPSVRTLEFIVSDGKTFAQKDSGAARHSTRLVESRSLTYRQVNRQPGRFVLTKTYVTDPRRSVLVVRVRLRSLTGGKLQLYAHYDPGLANDGMDDSGTTDGSVLFATDDGSPVASALTVARGFRQVSSGYVGTPSDGWEDIKDNYRMDGNYEAAPNGNLVQTGRVPVTGLRRQRTTLALGFGRTPAKALTRADLSLAHGFRTVHRAYARGWHRYLGRLKRRRRARTGGSTGPR